MMEMLLCPWAIRDEHDSVNLFGFHQGLALHALNLPWKGFPADCDVSAEK